jgi:hypothetical protein
MVDYLCWLCSWVVLPWFWCQRYLSHPEQRVYTCRNLFFIHSDHHGKHHTAWPPQHKSYAMLCLVSTWLGNRLRIWVTDSIFWCISWPESMSELYRPSNHRLLAKLVPIFPDRGYHMISMTDPYGHILGFLGRRRYFFFQIAPQLY